MRSSVLVVMSLLVAAPAAAQDHKEGSGFGDIKPLQGQFMGWVIAAAEQMPEADYTYKPTPAVRSFGELAGHVANANFAFCAAAKSEASPAKADYEKVKSKSEVVAGLRAAVAYCETAFAMPHGKEHEPTSVFGMKGSRLWVLTFNISHNAEHYGNMVTYMRMKGMTPPSSQGG